MAELRLEVIYSIGDETAVIDALVAAQPYEEPAFDLHPLVNVTSRARCGRVGRYDGDLLARLEKLDVGPVFVRRRPRPGQIAVFTGLPRLCAAATIVAPAGDPDVLVPELERWALRSRG